MKNMTCRFLCLGLVMNDILLGGVHELPKNWEQTVPAEKVRESTGGGAANSAITLGKLGCRVDIAGMIGRDAAGERVADELEKAGVNTEMLFRTDAASTGTAIGLVRENGDRCFITVRGSNALFSREHLKESEKRIYDFVHINGFFQLPSLEQDMPVLLDILRRKGSIISFDMASSDPTGRWFKAISPFADKIDFFFTNESQLEQLSGTDDISQGVLFLRKQGVKNIIVKLGKEGCCSFIQDTEPIYSSGFCVDAVDTTGAGDSFDAAYIAGIAAGWDMGACGRFANVVAGMNCSRIGATAGVPDYETALLLMKG